MENQIKDREQRSQKNREGGERKRSVKRSVPWGGTGSHGRVLGINRFQPTSRDRERMGEGEQIGSECLGYL